jgi:exopolysaccharide production protein ExoQ
MAYPALLLCLAFSAWIIIGDCRKRRSVSIAAWIPTALILILGSRPVSLWATGGRVWVGELGNYSENSALDLAFFVLVLSASLTIATLRKVKWARLVPMNAALFLFYLYFFISVSWSGDPVGSLKRIVKDLGLIFVIGVIYSEKDPLEAMRAVFVRSAAILIPLSVVFVKYFPAYSRAYTIAGGMMETGVTTQKNTLGEIILVFSIFLTWDYFESQRKNPKVGWARVPWDKILLLIMGLWLLRISQSKSALLCTIIGMFLVARGGVFLTRTVNRVVLTGAMALPFLVFFSQKFSSVIAPLVKALGRDMTFTGRANIWAHVTLSTVNPVIGAGYWNFWGGPGGFEISQQMMTIIPNAHCGYVDMYLDGGFIALILLFILLFTRGRALANRLRSKNDPARYLRVRFAFLIVAIIYNLSESIFMRMGALWFTTLLMFVDFPWKAAAQPALTKGRAAVSAVVNPRSLYAGRTTKEVKEAKTAVMQDAKATDWRSTWTTSRATD